MRIYHNVVHFPTFKLHEKVCYFLFDDNKISNGFIGYSMDKVNKGKVLRMVGFSVNCNNREVYLFSERFYRSYNISTRFASPSSYNSYTSILSIYTKIRHYMVREIVHLNLDELRVKVAAHDIRGRIKD